MGGILEQYKIAFPALILIFCRIAGLFIMSPIFSKQSIPIYWKIMLSVFLSYIVFSFKLSTTVLNNRVIGHPLNLLINVLKEILLGVIFGYITTIMFSAILLAGQLIDTQIGFGMVNVLDPQSNIQVPLLGNFNNIIALLLFLIIDGHHTLVNLLVASFDIIPIGQITIEQDIYIILVTIFKNAFGLAFKMALPIVGAALITESILGLMSKSIPQINVFAVGIPIKIFIGLITLFFFIPAYIALLKGNFSDMLKDIKGLMEAMSIE